MPTDHPPASAISTNQYPRPPGTTLLNGTVVLTLSKPIRVVSLAITLNGSSHLALSEPAQQQQQQHPLPSYSALATVTKKRIAHYSRQHLRMQQFLIEPSPDPDQAVTLVAATSNGMSMRQTQRASGNTTTREQEGERGERVEERSMPPSIELKPNQIAYPFAIQVPNHVPVSVTTPQGGTIYRLTAALTVAKPSKSRQSTGGFVAAILSAAAAATSSSQIVTAVTTVQIYRAGFLRCPARMAGVGVVAGQCDTGGLSEQQQQQHIIDRVAQRVDGASSEESGVEGMRSIAAEGQYDNEYDEGTMIPDSISYCWPEYLEASVCTPFVHLPLKSTAELHVRIKLLKGNIAIRNFQVALWERAVFRVAQTLVIKTGLRKKTRMTVVGVRERVVSTQRMEHGWPTTASSSAAGTRVVAQVAKFNTPSPLRGPNELYSSRNCNASTYSRVSKLERHNLREDLLGNDDDYGHGGDDSGASKVPASIELGDIEIEIQHFLRCSLHLTGVPSGLVPRNNKASGTHERVLGDIPVFIRGVPGGSECDETGLPTYMGSFATLLPSLEDEHSYETQTRASMSSSGGGDSILTENSSPPGTHGSIANVQARGSMLSLVSMARSASPHNDYENDDAFMAIVGLRGSRTPPCYEESEGRLSLDASASALHLASPVSDTDSIHSSSSILSSRESSSVANVVWSLMR
ncbi:hypothetical protein EDD11_007537 [Mortierella claussenii]|nr:hypothetical protein EDD11_007537 [Mortierella claussenii]